MIFSRGSTLSSKDGTDLRAAVTLSMGKSADNLASSLDTAIPPLPASAVASSGGSHPPDPPESSIPGLSVHHGADHHSSVDENDIVIAVMGLTGAGKSSFVHKAAGSTEVEINHDLRSQTGAVHPVRCTHPDGRRNVVLVDTPGFDDTCLSDVQILRIVASWLKETYQNNIKLAGILYLHRISDVRFGGTPLRNLAVFKDLCGESSLKNIVLVTTMWDELEDQSVGSKREEELLSDFWNDMIRLGSRTCRFQGTRGSAWEIINHLDLEGSLPLEIQREMVDRGLPLHKTSAAKTLLRFLLNSVGEFKKVWAKLRNGGRRRRAEPSAGLRLHAIPSRSSTASSSFSSTSWAAIERPSSMSSRNSSRNSSLNSTNPASPATSNSSGCSAQDRRDALLTTITGLRLLYQVADMASIPALRGAIGTALQIAQQIEGMGGTHHAISQVVENSGYLLEEMTRYAASSELPRDMKKKLRTFKRDLENIQKVVVKISDRGAVAGFFLHDVDVNTIAACTTSIREIYNKLEVTLAMDSRQAIARLEDQIKALRDNITLRRCECGMSVVPEEQGEDDSTLRPRVDLHHGDR